MKPIRIALVHHNTPRMLDDRAVGIWSYEVPEFEVTHFPYDDKHPKIDTQQFADDFDAIVQEDNKLWPEWTNDAEIPMFYYVVDSTLSDEHLHNRRYHAANFDVVMVDWDDLRLFEAPGREVWRVSHCVNDHMFTPSAGEKTMDVGFHCFRKGPGGERRIMIAERLEELCVEMGLVFDGNKYSGKEYAAAMAREKVTVQSNRTPNTRAHRTFDAMACRTCLLTERLPYVSHEFRQSWYHYVEWQHVSEIEPALELLLGADQQWERFAERGYQLIQRAHTWKQRARHLHWIMGNFLAKRGKWKWNGT